MERLLTEMASTFNEKNFEGEPHQINLNADNTLKWKGLHNNLYASVKRRTRKSAKIEEVAEEDRTSAGGATPTENSNTSSPEEQSVKSMDPPPVPEGGKSSGKSERVLRRTRTSSEVVEAKRANVVEKTTPASGRHHSPGHKSVNVVVNSTKSNKDKEQASAPTPMTTTTKDNSDEELLQAKFQGDPEQDQKTAFEEKTKATATAITDSPSSSEKDQNGDSNASQGSSETRQSKRVTRRRASTNRDEGGANLKRKSEDDPSPSPVAVTDKKLAVEESSAAGEDTQPAATANGGEEKKPRLLMKIRTDNKNISIIKPVEGENAPEPKEDLPETTEPTVDTQTTVPSVPPPPPTPATEPKKRGRKPGSTLKNKFGEKVKILPKRSGVRGQPSPEGSPPQRPSRRIKPTAKILENEELRHGFEQQNSARLGLNASELDAKKAALVKHYSGPQVEQLSVDNIYSTSNKPCPEPEDFLNELKNEKNGTEPAIQEEKLNRKEQKLKERHFHQLGLRKTSRSDTSSEPDDLESQNEDGPFRSPQRNNHHPKTNGNSRGPRENHQQRNFRKPNPPSNVLQSDDLQVRRKVTTNSVSREKFICLCTQMAEFYSHNKTTKSRYCSAVDQIRTERVGCCNDITGNQLNLQRPSARVSFMVLCQSHKNRFHSHHCCPVCGVFCTEGQFMLCPRNHLFHRDCVLRTNSYKGRFANGAIPCPHCGVEVAEPEVNLYMECRNELTYYPNQEGFIKTARISLTNGLFAVPQRSITNGHEQIHFDIDSLIPESVQNVRDRYRQRRSAHRSGSETSEFTSHEFFHAVNNDDIERVAEIIASGFDVSAPFKEFHHGTCLHLIAHYGSLNMMYLILSRVSSMDFINAQDKELRTAAMCAVVEQKHEILRLLVQCGADVAKKGPDGTTVLHLAAKVDNLTATKIILEHYRQKVTFQKFEAFINAVDDGQWTALVWAAENGLNEIESYLISLGASPNICDSENNSALHWAALSNRVEAILPLLGSNCDFNLQNVNGDTALHIACRHGNAHMCLIFIAHGADLQIKNLADEMPLDCVPDPTGTCAKLLKYNLSLKGITGGNNLRFVLSNDLSMGREAYPVKLIASTENAALPNFKYVTQAIIVRNSIQIDRRISQMRICACPDNCTSESCQCSEISSQNWYDANGRLSNEFNFDDPPMIFECNDVCGCHKLLCKNRVVQNGSKVALQVERSGKKIKGWSARSISEIPKGSFVSEYTGEILTNAEADQRMDDSYFFDLGGSEHCIDANFYGNVSRFFNHSCSPNVVPIRVYFDHQDLRFPKIAFFASENIAANQEITFDYGDKFWMVKHKYFTCQCDAPNCRYSAQTIAKTVEEINQRSQPITIIT